VLAQTDHQVGLLDRNYRRLAAVAPMALDVPATAPSHASRDIDVLWVANLRALKRPELFVELAHRLPRHRFHLVGGPVEGELEVHRALLAAAATVPNLTLHGRVGFADTLALFARARMFVSTSLIEGFPNTFLQAWAREVPSASFFDPDGVVERERLGTRVDSFDALVAAVDGVLGQPRHLATLAANCGQYMRTHYARGQLLRPYVDAIERVMRQQVA
jgi:glycosyltransferase involved in cell wall biosynthesis